MTLTPLLLAGFLPIACLAQAPENMIPNGAFVGDENGDGLADRWSYSSGASGDKLDVDFGLQELEPGRFAQRITCSRHEGGHAMICQVGTVAIEKGRWYEIKLRAKGENLRAASVGLHDTDGWKQLSGFWGMSLGKRSREFAFKFQGDHDCHETTRFQIWFSRTGTLWVSDVSLTPVETPPRRNILPDTGAKNLLPNAGFEALGGWGMISHWTYGWDVAEGRGIDGTNCAAIEWTPNHPEVKYCFDYFDMTERPQLDASMQAIGYAPLKPGETYTLSASMRCDREGAPAMLGLRGPGARSQKKIDLSTEWRRFSVTCEAKGDIALVQLGPIFADENMDAFEGCTVYIDNAQLERGEQATEFEASPLEAILLHRIQTVAGVEPLETNVEAAILCAESRQAEVNLRILDFADKPVRTLEFRTQIQQGVTRLEMPITLPGPGFYRVDLGVLAGEDSAGASARWAFTLPCGDDTPFGINHAYAREGFVRLATDIGISWARDWSLKWEHVETEKGAFTFDKTDFQIQRPQKLGMNVLCMFPFPSAEWSSTAPEELHKTGYPANRIRQAFAPKDPRELENYVFECVKRYEDQIKIWEVFNESVFTSYSLPKKYDYKAEDYVPLLKAVYQGCKRADPDCQVMGGYSGNPGGSHALLYQRMFEEGGLDYCDLVSLHIYPNGAPEFLDADLKRLNAMMDENGGRKPTWMTEYAYYADDDPDPITRRWPTLLGSEWRQACWNTRACVIMLANGVEKVFYHIWSTHLNRDSGARIFFEYAGAPRKIAAAQAAMTYFLGGEPKCVGELPEQDEDVFGYTFQTPGGPQAEGEEPRLTTVLWLPYDSAKIARPEGCQCFDLCGRRITGDAIPLGEAPVYIKTTGRRTERVIDEIQEALRQAGVR